MTEEEGYGAHPGERLVRVAVVLAVPAAKEGVELKVGVGDEGVGVVGDTWNGREGKKQMLGVRLERDDKGMEGRVNGRNGKSNSDTVEVAEVARHLHPPEKSKREPSAPRK